MRVLILVIAGIMQRAYCRDEEKILKSCYWPNEVYEPCFGGCAEVSCDNPRNHLRPCYPYCEPGCVCDDPYVRDDRTHQCVLPQDCSPTQMGIPVPSRRGSNLKPALGPGVGPGAGPVPVPKYDNRSPRMAPRFPTKNDISPQDLNEQANDLPASHGEDFKRTSEVARMGNYFNIVIAPPPIKALQPRKLISPNNVFRGPSKNLA